jgi:Subtilase family
VQPQADKENYSDTRVASSANAWGRGYLRRSLSFTVLTLGLLLLLTSVLPSGAPSRVEETHVERSWRQRVVIFLIDTLEDFDSHGTYVYSVLRQQCPHCEVQAINLHGDLGLSSVIHALQQVHSQSQAYDPSTTALVNLSLGTYTYDQDLHATVRALETSGLVLIAAAGNDNTTRPFYPAAFREVLGVCSSTRHTRVKAAYSNFGDWISLCAPGLQYVSRPLQHGEVASGTSLAAPMVTGVLGQLLLEAPCAPPQAGIRALLRTADVIAESKTSPGAGLLNPAAARHYMHSLYPCGPPATFLPQLLARAKRLGTRTGMTLGVLAYFVLSIFTVPFLLAFVIEHIQRRTAHRQQQAWQQAYAHAATYRRQRLLALRCHFQQAGNMRRRDRVELFALLSALHRHGEPCWWCDKLAVPPTAIAGPSQGAMACSRCGMERLTTPDRPKSDSVGQPGGGQ